MDGQVPGQPLRRQRGVHVRELGIGHRYIAGAVAQAGCDVGLRMAHEDEFHAAVQAPWPSVASTAT